LCVFFTEVFFFFYIHIFNEDIKSKNSKINQNNKLNFSAKEIKKITVYKNGNSQREKRKVFKKLFEIFFIAENLLN